MPANRHSLLSVNAQQILAATSTEELVKLTETPEDVTDRMVRDVGLEPTLGAEAERDATFAGGSVDALVIATDEAPDAQDVASLVSAAACSGARDAAPAPQGTAAAAASVVGGASAVAARKKTKKVSADIDGLDRALLACRAGPAPDPADIAAVSASSSELTTTVRRFFTCVLPFLSSTSWDGRTGRGPTG